MLQLPKSLEHNPNTEQSVLRKKKNDFNINIYNNGLESCPASPPLYEKMLMCMNILLSQSTQLWPGHKSREI